MIGRGSRLCALIAALAVAAGCAVALAGCDLGDALKVGSRLESTSPAAKRLDRELNRVGLRAPLGTTVRLDRLTSFEWDRVYVFGSFSAETDVNAAVGVEVFYGDGGFIEDDEGLLVFTSGDELALATTIFPEIYYSGGPLFSREDAVLKVDRSGLRFAGRGRPGRGE